MLIILVPIVAFLVLLFAVPPFVTFTSQRLIRPNAVKRSWDWLNIILVLFAILCGIFARKNDDESASGEEDDNSVSSSNAPSVARNISTNVVGESESVSISQQWFGFSERNKIYHPVNSTPAGGANGARGLRRSSSSYPDLRQLDSPSEADRFQFRFFDDYEIFKYRPPTADHADAHQPRRRSDADEADVKVINVDTFVLRTPPKSPAPPPPPPPPPPAAQRKPRRATYRTVGGRNEKLNDVVNNDTNGDKQSERVGSSPPTPPPPPPPRPPAPPSPVRIRSDQRCGKFERRKSNVKKDIATALTSLYNQRKRKKKQKTNLYETATSSPPEQEPSYHTSSMPPPSPPPPPPPPPPPSSVFHSFFKKGIGKSKRVHSVPVPPPPPPPSARSSKHKSRSLAPPTPPPPPPVHTRRRIPTTGGRPPLPTRSYDENVNSGCQSPLIPMPPPPPPPPFKMPEWKFHARGDFVKIRSASSSRCSSPELDDADPPSIKVESETVRATNGGDGVGPAFCPSPDVNLKADDFIATLRQKWKLEKMNSLKEKQRMGHSGPGSSTVMRG